VTRTCAFGRPASIRRWISSLFMAAPVGRGL
jgi:hypothetical protein